MTMIRQEQQAVYGAALIDDGLPEIQLAYKKGSFPRQAVDSPNAANKVLRQIWKESLNIRESTYILFLNIKNETLGFIEHSTGGISECSTDIRLIFAAAVGCGATSMIFAHNHPSGDTTPSVADRNFTRQLRNSCEIMRIQLVDAMIITEEGFFSFRESGVL